MTAEDYDPRMTAHGYDHHATRVKGESYEPLYITNDATHLQHGLQRYEGVIDGYHTFCCAGCGELDYFRVPGPEADPLNAPLRDYHHGLPVDRSLIEKFFTNIGGADGDYIEVYAHMKDGSDLLLRTHCVDDETGYDYLSMMAEAQAEVERI